MSRIRDPILVSLATIMFAAFGFTDVVQGSRLREQNLSKVGTTISHLTVVAQLSKRTSYMHQHEHGDEYCWSIPLLFTYSSDFVVITFVLSPSCLSMWHVLLSCQFSYHCCYHTSRSGTSAIRCSVKPKPLKAFRRSKDQSRDPEPKPTA